MKNEEYIERQEKEKTNQIKSQLSYETDQSQKSSYAYLPITLKLSTYQPIRGSVSYSFEPISEHSY